MHGLIFVTWEKFVLEQYGSSSLAAYREAIATTPACMPLASRAYADEILVQGITEVSKLTNKTVPVLLREFGRYFIVNNLTGRLCSYLLTRVHCARDLLLIMRVAHKRMSNADSSIAAPIFAFEVLSDNPNELLLTYDSHRKLCPVLMGAIEGAAIRFGESVTLLERTCMANGARACILEVRFSGRPQVLLENTLQRQHRQEQKQIADVILQVLPPEKGLTLQELQKRLEQFSLPYQQTRPSVLLSVITQLLHAGMISSTVNQQGDDLSTRRYWRQRT